MYTSFHEEFYHGSVCCAQGVSRCLEAHHNLTPPQLYSVFAVACPILVGHFILPTRVIFPSVVEAIVMNYNTRKGSGAVFGLSSPAAHVSHVRRLISVTTVFVLHGVTVHLVIGFIYVQPMVYFSWSEISLTPT